MARKRQAANSNGVRGTDTGVAGGCSSPSTRTKFKNMSDGLEPREGEQMTQKRQAANLNGVRGTDTGVAGGCSSPSTRTKYAEVAQW